MREATKRPLLQRAEEEEGGNCSSRAPGRGRTGGKSDIQINWPYKFCRGGLLMLKLYV